MSLSSDLNLLIISPADLVVTIYLLSVLTLCTGLAGANIANRFSIIGATRTLTQLFSYEAPFLLSLFGPAIAAGSWDIAVISTYVNSHPWMLVYQPIGFVVSLIGLMGKLELPPFDAPEAETEIVSGALTEYSGRGYALFRLGRNVELVIGLTLVAAFYMGGVANPLLFLAKTLGLLFIIAALQSLFARLRIDQTVGLWWRVGTLLVSGSNAGIDHLERIRCDPMKISSMIGDIFQSLFKKPATIQYPLERIQAPDRDITVSFSGILRSVLAANCASKTAPVTR